MAPANPLATGKRDFEIVMMMVRLEVIATAIAGARKGIYPA
jgi:hypothetical protein